MSQRPNNNDTKSNLLKPRLKPDDDDDDKVKTPDEVKSDSKDSKQSRWSLATITDSFTYQIEAWSYLQHKDFELHLLQKEVDPKPRTRIPTTEKERLAYYWAYTTSSFKLQISYLQSIDYTGFIWIYINNVLLKSLPTNYIHIFLAAYSPDEHLFGSKMIPILHGISWLIILCGLLQLVACADCLALYIHYAYIAFNNRNPWSRCNRNWTRIKQNPHLPEMVFRCVDLKGFLDLTSTANQSFTFKYNYYYLPQNHTLFTISYLKYFIVKWRELNVDILKYKYDFVLNFSIVWIVAALFYNQLYRRYLWKNLYRLQVLVNLFYVMTFFYIFAYGLGVELKSHDLRLTNTDNKTIELAKHWDFDFQAESISGPPVVHLLTSRSSDTINPERDSALVTASNSFMYFLKGFVYYRLKVFIEHRTRVPLRVSPINPYPIFYVWAFFFESLLFGSVIARIFYIIICLKEFILFIITYQLLVDVILCEWQQIKRWVTTLLLTIIGLTLSCTLLYTTKMLLYIFTTAITGLTEVVVICWLYPLKRFADDIHFHSGTPAANWRIWSFGILPSYFIYKTYVIFHTLMVEVHKKMKDHQKNSVNADWSATKWVWAVGFLPLPLGALYAVLKHVIMKKPEAWRDLFNPLPDWGPKEYLARQLRKQFEAKRYVGSQASRYLSRHMITRAEPITYNLDLCYDDTKKRPTGVNNDDYQGEWKIT